MKAQIFGFSSQARAYGAGGIWYRYKIESQRRFPQDVASVMIVLPGSVDGETVNVVTEWTVDRKNQNGAQWKLSGTAANPTLSPSLNWVGQWHGWLKNGQLEKC